MRPVRPVRRGRPQPSPLAVDLHPVKGVANGPLDSEVVNLRFHADRWTAFFVPKALLQNLPDQTTEPVGDGTDRLRVSKPSIPR